MNILLSLILIVLLADLAWDVYKYKQQSKKVTIVSYEPGKPVGNDAEAQSQLGAVFEQLLANAKSQGKT